MGANIAGDTIQQVAGRGRLASSLLPMHQPSIDESEAMPPPLFTSLLVYSPTCGLCCSVLLWVVHWVCVLVEAPPPPPAMACGA